MADYPPETDKLDTLGSHAPNYSQQANNDFNVKSRKWTPFQLQVFKGYFGSLNRSQQKTVNGSSINPETGRPYASNSKMGDRSAYDQNRIQAMDAADAAQPHEYEDYNDWIARVNQVAPDFATYMKDANLNEEQYNQFSGFDPEKKRAFQQRKMLDDFTKEMMGPLDLTNPETKRMLDNIQSRIGSSNRHRGIDGGMVASAEARGVGDAILGETARRKEIGLRAYGMANVNAGQQAAMSEEAKNRAALVEYQNNLTAFETRRSGMQLGFGIGGGIAGAVAGGYASGGAGAVAGAGAGIGIGSAIGGLAAGGPPSYPSRAPRNGMTGGGY